MPYRTVPTDFIPSNMSSILPEHPEKFITRSVLCKMCKKKYKTESYEPTREQRLEARYNYRTTLYEVKNGFCSEPCSKKWANVRRRTETVIADLNFFQRAWSDSLVGPHTITIVRNDQVTSKYFYGVCVSEAIKSVSVNMVPYILSLLLHRGDRGILYGNFDEYFKTDYPEFLDYEEFTRDFNAFGVKAILDNIGSNMLKHG